MSQQLRSLACLGTAAALVASLSGCGGSSSSPTQPSTPAPPPTTMPIQTATILDTTISGLGPLFVTDLHFTTRASGELKAKVQWQSKDDHIIVYLAEGSCPFSKWQTGDCNFLAVSEAKTPKPRNLTAPNAPADSYVLWVGNLGPKTENLSVLVRLTTGG
jgi:hypothetical protein